MTRPLHLLQVIGSAGPGGAESFYLRLVLALREQITVTPVVREGSWLAERLTEANVPFQTARFGGVFDFSTKGRLRDLVAHEKPDLVQTWMNRASGFMPKVQMPVVGRMGGYYNLKYYRTANHLVGNTEDICRYMREQGRPAGQVHYIPNFVDEPRPDFVDYRFDVRDEYGIPEHAPVLLMAGRLHENKGFDVALSSLAQLPENVYLIIAGTGPEEDALRAAAQADDLTDRVRFVGWMNRITPLCAAADIFLVPSRHEPLGNVVLDGWAHKLPVIATDTVGPRGLITDGDNGLLVPVGNENALSDAIRRLIAAPDMAATLAARGHETLAQTYSRAQVVEQYLNFYRTLVGR